MYLSIRTHQPDEHDDQMCKDRSPGGVCTLTALHSGLHVAHGADRTGYYIIAIWDGDRTTDGEQP